MTTPPPAIVGEILQLQCQRLARLSDQLQRIEEQLERLIIRTEQTSNE